PTPPRPHSPRHPYTTLFRSSQSKPVLEALGGLQAKEAYVRQARALNLQCVTPWTLAPEHEVETLFVAQAQCCFPKQFQALLETQDRKSTRLNSSHVKMSYAA